MSSSSSRCLNYSLTFKSRDGIFPQSGIMKTHALVIIPHLLSRGWRHVVETQEVEFVRTSTSWIQKSSSESDWVRGWRCRRGLHFDVPVAVHNPPLTSAASRSDLIDHKIVLVCAQTLFAPSAPIPTMISEAKLAAFSDFPHILLCGTQRIMHRTFSSEIWIL